MALPLCGQVEVPKFPRRIEYDKARVNYVPRRRPLDVIRREIDTEYERMRTVPQPPPSRKPAIVGYATQNSSATSAPSVHAHFL